jgi:ribulose-phosphate 3-epimerase
MNIELAPSILSCDQSQLSLSVQEMMDAGVDWIHFDIMDGQFVPPITFGDQSVKDLRKLGPTPFEAHLMTLTPEKHFDAFIKAGCSRIIFHAEATSHAHRLTQDLKARGIQSGVSINPGTPICMVEPYLDFVDLVLVMTVNPGWGGQQFLPSMLAKIRQLRALRSDVDIEVDGGIVPDNIKMVNEAGANVFVTGSYLMRAESISKGVAALRQSCG